MIGSFGTATLRLLAVALLAFALPVLAETGWASTTPAPTKERKRVLVLFSEDETHPAHEMTQQGIREVFSSNTRFDVQIYTEYLDEARFGSPSHEEDFANYLIGKYSGTDLHAVIAVYPRALDLLIAGRRRLFSGIPIVATEIASDYAAGLEQSPHRGFVTATVVGDNVGAVIDTILRLRPETKRVALVSGVSPNDVYGERLIRGILRQYAGRLELIGLTGLSLVETLSRVGSLPGDSAVLYESVLRDATGKNFVPRQALSLIAQASNVPVFGLYESFLGFGIVGGPLVSFERHGREAAALVLRVLAGEAPASIAFRGEHTYVDAYDWRELERWGIPEEALPSGSEIRYRVPTFWEEHWQIVLGVALAFLGESLLVLALLANIRTRRRTQSSLRESEERVRMAVSASGTGLWSLDLDTGGLWATDRTRELFGFGPDEPLTLEKVLEAVHPEDRELVRSETERAVESGEETSLEYRLAERSGSVRSVYAQGRLQADGAGRPRRLMGTCTDVTQRRIADDLLRDQENELRTLAGRLINTQEEELRRLARELHDDLTQRLAALSIDAGVLAKSIASCPPQAPQELKALREGLIEVSNDVHNLSRQLHPTILDDLGLVRASQAECESFRRRTGIDVAFESGNVPSAVPNDVALCLYRVMQEALRNVEKHSTATEARVVLEGLPGGLRLSIRDGGIGFDAEKGKTTGIGLSSMRERVRLVDGTLSIVSEPGKGTEVRVSVPVGEGADDEAEGPDR